MSISSTGIYGNTSILNSEIYTDIINEIEDINTNKIPNLILDISENTSNINDISNMSIYVLCVQSLSLSLSLSLSTHTHTHTHPHTHPHTHTHTHTPHMHACMYIRMYIRVMS